MARSRKRKKIIINPNWKLATAIGAVAVFIIALVYYFTSTFIVTEREYAVYTSMEEPTLPVIYAEVNGREINAMHGYLQDMGSNAASDCITPLPEDRKLNLKIKLSDGNISAIRYEVRSLDFQHFIEKTELDGFTTDENGEITAVLPIQNMISYDTPYILKLQLDLGEKTINYYTKIIWSQSQDINNMIDSAAEFTEKTFDYEKARDLTVYLEADPNADTDTLATVGIGSSFSQITWGSTNMKLTSDLEIKVKEYDGIMGAVEVSYTSESDSDSDNSDRYYNNDEFTMRAGSERIYMMNFERKTNQIFEGNKHLFTGKRINLGIVNKESLQTKKSENSRYIAFKVGRELWLYDQQGKKAVNVFSFRSENDVIRADYDMHNIKILSVDDNGTVDFAVYGYMNRGRHEGYNGIVCYRYQNNTESISELFFIPRATTYEKIKEELDELLVKADTGMVYIKQDDAITAIDLASLEMLDTVYDIYDKRYAISKDQTKAAWVEGDDDQNSIKLMDLSTGSTKTINAEPGEILSVIDFYAQDLIYGISNTQDVWKINGRDSGRLMHTLKIVSADLTEIMNYQKDGLYFEDIVIDGDRIQIGQYRKTGDNSYQYASKDTIVSSSDDADNNLESVSSDISDTKKRIYYIDLDENIRTTRTLDVSAPKTISYEKSGVLELTQHKSSVTTRYYAYANGKMKGVAYSLKDAVDMCYDDKGWVEDSCSSVLYSRCDRVSLKSIKDPFNAAQPLLLALQDNFTDDSITDDGYIIMNAQGIAINKLLYYVSKGYPVLAYLDNGEYCLIHGYTAENVEIFYPSEDDNGSSRSETMSIDDAAALFARYQNDFVVFTRYSGK